MGRSRSRAKRKAATPASGRARARPRPAAAPPAEAPAALGEYWRKRDFAQTPEPAGGAAPERRGGDRMFVIQKHAARQLHYDFRLELEGTLKSWAVPKGPSLDPADKRLAMHVEDHPVEYAGFEGIIPKGEYGGGTVLLWDRGTWRPEGDPHKDYRAGNLKFSLEGDKLRGSWALVRIKGGRDTRGDGRSWLLIKHGDAEARPTKAGSVVEARPESVATGRTLEEIAAASDRVWHSNRFDGASEAPAGAAKTRAAAAARATAGRSTPAAPARDGKAAAALAAELSGARPGSLPRFVAPQLATLVGAAPAGEQWLHELKFDGYRILARVDEGRVQLLSRNDRDWTDHFPAVASAAARLPARRALLDGEVAMLLPDGTTSFQALQNAGAEEPRGQLVYMVFDLLHLDGHDLTGAGLEDRKRVLRALVDAGGAAADPVRYSDHVVGSGPEFFEQACRHGLEGIISKRRDAPYRGARGTEWQKVKCLKRQEVVIGGYTDPEGSRVGIGALLAGVYDDGRLVYAGKVGTGFTDKSLRDLEQRLRALRQDAAPFATRSEGVPRAHWVKPELVAEVAFSEWTADGRMRHPSYQGLREDKPAAEVVRERPVSPRAAASDDEPSSAPATRAAARRRPKGLVEPSRATAGDEGRARADAENGAGREPASPRPLRSSAPNATGHRGSRGGVTAEVAGVRLTHADRVLYPPQGTTKLDLARYYESIADWILPHLADRPTTLVRCPDGAHKQCFYQKHVGYWAPEEIRRVKIRERTKTGEYLVVDALPALIGLVQIGILEIHTWNSVVSDLEHPDRIVIDLDPAPDVEWRRVVEAAHDVRARLAATSLESFPKTTGGKGLHVVVPLERGATWEQCAGFASELAGAMAREHPEAYVASMAKSERAGRIFVDYLRNVRGATSIAAYSTRATPAAPVSVPLTWDELTPRVRSDQFSLASVRERLSALRADPWERYWSVRQRLPGTEGASGRAVPTRSRRGVRRSTA